MSTARPARFVCPVDVTLSVINGKWKSMILWLLVARPCRVRDFQAAMPSVAHKVLSEQLRQLESDGLVCRVSRGSHVQRMDYQLTDFGRSLRPALGALANLSKTDHAMLGVEYGPPGDAP